jgi:hypothetical protein
MIYWAIFEHKLGSSLKSAIFIDQSFKLINKFKSGVCSKPPLKQDNLFFIKGNTKISYDSTMNGSYNLQEKISKRINLQRDYTVLGLGF